MIASGGMVMRSVGVALGLVAGCTPVCDEACREGRRQAALGMLPRGTIDLPPRGGLEIRVAGDVLSVGDAAVLALREGRITGGVEADRVVPTLRVALASRAVNVAQEPNLPEVWASVRAHRHTPFVTLGLVLHTAVRAGFTDFELVVDDGARERGQPISVPLEWDPPPSEWILERPLGVVFVVHADTVEASVKGEPVRRFAALASCPTAPAGCHDLAAVVDYAKTFKRLHPNEVVAFLRVDDEVPLHALVALIDAVRGPGCGLAGAYVGDKVPDECLLWQPVLDFQPPLRGAP